MKIQIPALVLAICCTVAAAAQQAAKPAAAPVELTAEPSHHLKINNEYIRAFYNLERRHSHLEYLTPFDFEQKYVAERRYAA